LYGPGKTHGNPDRETGRRFFPEIQRIQQGAIQPYGVNAAQAPVPAKEARVKSISVFFVQHFEEVEGTLIPPGQGLSYFSRIKEDNVHQENIAQRHGN
jgi:hypothetical protein